MKMQRLSFLFLAATLLLLLLPGNAFAGAGWATIKNEHFIVFYKPGQEDQANQVLKTMEYYRLQVEKLCGNETRHYPIVIDDAGTIANGFNNAFLNQIHLFQYPFTWGIENWWSDVGVHEYTHQLSLSKSTGLPGALKKVFGNIFLPNLYSPGWMVEGITVYSESQLSPYQGRLNVGLYDAFIGASAAQGRLPSILDATYAPLTYQMNGLYTFGSEFFNYLSKTYGEDKFAQLFAENGGSLGFALPFPALSIDGAAIKVYGKPFPELWAEWLKYETQRYHYYRIDGEQVTRHGWDISSPVIADGKIYYQKSYPVKTGAFKTFNFHEVVARDLTNGEERVLVSTTAGFSLPLKVREGKLYYACLDIRPGYANASQLSYGGYSVIHEYDLDSGSGRTKDRAILKEGLRAFDILADGSILYAKDRDTVFGSDIYRFDPVAAEKKLIFESDYRVSEIVNDGKKIVVSAQKDWENLSLYSLNIETHEFLPLVHTPYIEGHPSLQGDKLFYTANYQKIPGVFCYDFTDGQVYQLTGTGMAESSVYDAERRRLYFLSLNSCGYDLYGKDLEFDRLTPMGAYQLPDSQPSLPPSLDNISETTFSKGNYLDNLKTLSPKLWSPVFAATPGVNSEYGFEIYGGDAVGDFPVYMASLTYNAKAKKLNYLLDLTSYYFAPLNITLKISDRNQIIQPIFPEDLAHPDQKYIRLDLEYPLVTKLSPGLANLSIGASLNYQYNLTGLAVAPYLNMGFKYPKTDASLQVGSSVRKMVHDNTYIGFYGDLKAIQYLSHSQLSFEIYGVEVLDNQSAILPPIRGYDKVLSTGLGSVFSLEYSRPLLKIRKGLWNPNIYFEDLTAMLFLDEAFGKGLVEERSWGAELHLETKTMYSASIDWGLRYVRYLSGEGKFEVFLESLK